MLLPQKMRTKPGTRCGCLQWRSIRSFFIDPNAADGTNTAPWCQHCISVALGHGSSGGGGGMRAASPAAARYHHPALQAPPNYGQQDPARMHYGSGRGMQAPVPPARGPTLYHSDSERYSPPPPLEYHGAGPSPGASYGGSHPHEGALRRGELPMRRAGSGGLYGSMMERNCHGCHNMAPMSDEMPLHAAIPDLMVLPRAFTAPPPLVPVQRSRAAAPAPMMYSPAHPALELADFPGDSDPSPALATGQDATHEMRHGVQQRGNASYGGEL